MKLSETSIIKGLSIRDSIIAAFNEMLKDRSSSAYTDCLCNAAYTDCLVVDGLVGKCIEVEVNDTYTKTRTSYFIATEILGTDFVRVDFCDDYKTVWNKQ
tara:strand:- start:113 stop:412 length:300 start_codon:yes stop_codon:yes gene_type:complete